MAPNAWISGFNFTNYNKFNVFPTGNNLSSLHCCWPCVVRASRGAIICPSLKETSKKEIQKLDTHIYSKLESLKQSLKKDVGSKKKSCIGKVSPMDPEQY